MFYGRWEGTNIQGFQIVTLHCNFNLNIFITSRRNVQPRNLKSCDVTGFQASYCAGNANIRCQYKCPSNRILISYCGCMFLVYQHFTLSINLITLLALWTSPFLLNNIHYKIFCLWINDDNFYHSFIFFTVDSIRMSALVEHNLSVCFKKLFLSRKWPNLLYTLIPLLIILKKTAQTVNKTRKNSA